MRSICRIAVSAVFALSCSIGLNWAADSILLSESVNPNARLGPLQNTVRSVACEEGVPPEFALAIIEQESQFKNEMRGTHGEIGASQILPATATALGFDTARLGRDFAYNAHAGVRILKMLLRRSAGDQREASCCYRAGPAWTKLPAAKQSLVLGYALAIERLKRSYSGLDCRP